MAIRILREAHRRRLRAIADGVLTPPVVIDFLRAARGDPGDQDWPLLFDARSATCALTEVDVDRAVELVRDALEKDGLRAHVALVASDDELFRWLVLYESRCAAIGVNVIRAFRQIEDAERWLEIMSSARRFG